MIRTLVTFICSVMLLGCRRPHIPDGIFACKESTQCPNGFSCHEDGFCYRESAILIDAALSAASLIDAAMSAGADGGLDACSPMLEVCNGRDDDCDGVIDEMAAAQLDCESKVVHAQTVCQSGYCLRIACLTGYYNCDGRPENGCESSCPCGSSCEDAAISGDADAATEDGSAPGDAGGAAGATVPARAGTGGTAASMGSGNQGGTSGSGGGASDHVSNLPDCCGAGVGVCVKPAMIDGDFKNALRPETCASGTLCEPIQRARDSTYKFPACTSNLGSGVCISRCILDPNQAAVLSRAGCTSTEACAPCSLGGAATNICD